MESIDNQQNEFDNFTNNFSFFVMKIHCQNQ